MIVKWSAGISRIRLLSRFRLFGIAAVTVLIAASQSNAESIVKTDPRGIEWGHVSRGLALGIATDRRSYALGSAIPVHVAIRNSGPTVSIFRVAIAQLYDIEIRDKAGRPLTRHTARDHGFSGSYRSHWTIPNGELYETDFANLTWYFDIDEPGWYTLTYSTRIFLSADSTTPYATLKSGSITFEIVK